MRSYEVEPELAQSYVDQVHALVQSFKDKYTAMAERKPHLWGTPSKAALYNYALSLMNIEYFKLNKEYRAQVLEQYK